VLGRKTLTASEIRQMLHAETIVNGYKLRSSMDAADFAKDYPELNKMLIEAQILTEKLEDY
jgi:hypothetical protein